MAIPDSPLTRSEEYLNNIATGEGAIPDVPLTRIEQYLDYITKNGGSGGGGSGGGVFFVDCTLVESQITAEKTAGEIFEAVESGLVVIFKFISGPMKIYMQCFSADNMDGYKFAVALKSGDNFAVNMFTAGDSSDNPVLRNK